MSIFELEILVLRALAAILYRLTYSGTKAETASHVADAGVLGDINKAIHDAGKPGKSSTPWKGDVL